MTKLGALLFLFFSILSSAYAEEEITVATYNVGYLDQVFFLGAVHIYVPEYQARLALFKNEFSKAFSQENQPDIIAVQELWHKDAAEVVNSTFKEQGYTAVLDTFINKISIPHFTNHGLNIYIKTEKFEISKPEFHRINRHEGEVAFRYFRGVLGASLKSISSSKTIFIGTTHLTPTIGMTETRRVQLSQIAEHMNSKTEDRVIMTGDFNTSPSFEFSITGRTQEGSHEEWETNGSLYHKFIQDTSMIDSYTEVNSGDGYTQDRTKNDLADFSASTSFEPEQRIDYVLYTTNAENSCSTVSSNLFFTEPVSDSNGEQYICS